jgi:N-acetylglucosaminyl-diphospho-decaprenol L-rhamnosyltransferase
VTSTSPQPDSTPSPRPEDLDAAVVIVNYRTAALVEQCLASVRATCGDLTLETVVIDNASGDGSVERLRAQVPGAKVIAMEHNRGFAAGVNAGFRHCGAESVIVLNPDTEVRPGALQAILARLREQPRTAVVAPLLEDADGQLTPNGYRRFPGLFTLGLDLCLPLGYALAHAPALHPYAMSPAALLAGRRPEHVCGAAMAIRRAAYEQAGPLDEGFFLYLEETEWQRRIVAHGWAIELLPQARVCHLVRGGGAGAEAPSPHFVGGALRYLRLQGVPVVIARAVLSVALACSWLTLRLIACLPAKRAKATSQARAYRSLLRHALTDAVAPR